MSAKINRVSEIVKKTTERNYSDEEFSKLSAKQLRSLANYTEGLVAPALIMEMWKTKPLTSADQAAAKAYAGTLDRTFTAHFAPEDAILAGMNVKYFPGRSVLTSVDGKESSRPMTPIPVPFGKPELRTTTQRIAVFISSFVTVKGSEWKVSSLEFVSTKYVSLSQVSVSVFLTLATRLLSTDPIWVGSADRLKSALTGAAIYSQVVSSLDRLSDADFAVLETSYVANVWNAFDRSEKDNWSRIQDVNGPVVPPASYSAVPLKKLSKEVAVEHKGADFPCHARPLTDFQPKVRVTRVPPKLEEVIKLQRETTQFLGGESSYMSLAMNSKGFTSLSSERGRKWQMIVSLVLSAASYGKPVDVVLQTVGDLAIIHASLLAHQKKFLAWLSGPAMASSTSTTTTTTATAAPGSQASSSPKFVSPLLSWKFILPTTVKTVSIPVELRPFVAHTFSDDSLVVFYSPDALPNAQSKTERLDYDDVSFSSFPVGLSLNRPFIGYTTVYGCAFFMQDPEVSKQVAARTDVFEKDRKAFSAHVYHYGSAHMLGAVVSSFSDLKIYGYGQLENDSTEAFRVLPLSKIASQQAWYSTAIQDMSRAYAYPFSTKFFYSPISNLIVTSRFVAAKEITESTPDGLKHIPSVRIVSISSKKDYLFEQSDDEDERSADVGEGDDGDSGESGVGASEHGGRDDDGEDEELLVVPDL